MPKIAALDLGSNSFHLLIAERVSATGFAPARALKEKVQLGQAAFATGAIDRPAFERGLAALSRLRRVLDEERPSSAVGVATSALREARNGQAFVREAAALTGVPIRIISGDEEARLMCLGTLEALGLHDRRVGIVDLGGGSTEIVVSHRGLRRLTTSLPLGTLRLASAFPCSALPSAHELVRLERAAAEILGPTLDRVERLEIDTLVLSSGSARKLVRLARTFALETGEHDGTPVLSRRVIAALQTRLAALSPIARAALLDGDPSRADTLLVAATIFRALLGRLGLTHALISSAGLREGLVADELARTTAPGELAYAVAL